MPDSGVAPKSPIGETRRFAATVEFVRAADGEDTFEASISSETPIEHNGALEILDHSEGAVNLERAKDGLPFLLDHDQTKVIGRVLNLRLQDRRLRGTLRFGKSQLAREVLSDVRAGNRREVSVAGSIEDARQEDGGVVRITRWMPVETSMVGIAADPTVGIGRARPDPKGPTKMENQETNRGGESAAQVAVERERNRIADINELGRSFECGELAQAAVRDGLSTEQFQGQVLERLQVRRRQDPLSQASTAWQGADGERKPNFDAFSITRAMALAAKRVPLDGLEGEVHQELCRACPREPAGFLAPSSIFFKPEIRRDLTVGTASAGGDTVGTNLLGDRFIEFQRVRLRVQQLGATFMSGLSANVAIPRQTATATAAWIAEAATRPQSELAVDQIALAPNSIGARQIFTRELAVQSTPAIEGLVRSDLANAIASEIDRVAINGSGSGNEPAGVLQTAGISVVAIGTDGGPLTWDHVVQLEGALADDNADGGSLGYLTNSAVRTKLKTTPKVSGQPVYIWQDGQTAEEGRLNGYRAAVSNNVPRDLTKGSGTNLSAVLFGNWSDLIVAEWGVVDIVVDPFTLSDEGKIKVVASAMVDVAVRHPVSFAAIKDADTA